jgi:hypothetical protein
MERGRLDELLTEQGRSMSGLVSGASQLGGFDGVDYLIYGRITQLSLEAQNSFIIMECKARFGLDVRVVDVHSGEIRLSESIQARDTLSIADSQSDPCRGVSVSALEKLTTDSARQIAQKMTIELFPPKVARVNLPEVYLNYGQDLFVGGDLLVVSQLGEGFLDPDTGEVIGQEETVIGLLEVVDVRPKFSIAMMIYQAGDVSIGDVARILSPGESKNLNKQISSCRKAERNRDKYCTKGGSKCAKYSERARNACDLL